MQRFVSECFAWKQVKKKQENICINGIFIGYVPDLSLLSFCVLKELLSSQNLFSIFSIDQVSETFIIKRAILPTLLAPHTPKIAILTIFFF